MLRHRKRIPTTLKSEDAERLESAAKKRELTKSKYIEQAVLKQLKADKA